MGLERQDDGGPAPRPRVRNHPPEQVLVAEMHPVEVPDGHDGTVKGSLDVPQNPHHAWSLEG